MAITFNGPKNISSPSKPSSQKDFKSQTPQEKRKNREKERIQKNIQRDKSRLEKLEKLSFSSLLRNLALKTAQPAETEKEPTDLFLEVLPVLKKTDINNIAVKRKTEIIEEKKIGTRKQKNLYKILIRREAEISSDIIKRLNREDEFLDKIFWSNDGIVFHIWGETFTIEEEEKGEKDEGPIPNSVIPDSVI